METFVTVLEIVGGIIAANAVSVLVVTFIMRAYNIRRRRKGKDEADPDVFLFFGVLGGPLVFIILAVGGAITLVEESTLRKDIYSRLKELAEGRDIPKERKRYQYEVENENLELKKKVATLERQLAEYVMLDQSNKENVGS